MQNGVGLWDAGFLGMDYFHHLVRDEGVAGSNPATPTNFLEKAIATGPDMGNETPCSCSSPLAAAFAGTPVAVLLFCEARS
jgi:hypothetical protein